LTPRLDRKVLPGGYLARRSAAKEQTDRKENTELTTICPNEVRLEAAAEGWYVFRHWDDNHHHP